MSELILPALIVTSLFLLSAALTPRCTIKDKGDGFYQCRRCGTDFRLEMTDPRYCPHCGRSNE